MDAEPLPSALLLRAAQGSAFGLTLADARLPDLPLIYANRAFRNMTGYGGEDIIGQNCRFLQGPETDPDCVLRIREALEGGRASTFLILNYRKDGSRFWNRFQLSPVHDDAGELIAYFGMQVDISEDVDRIGLENERHKLETLGRLAGGVAHDLNNALQPILLSAELLDDGSSLDAEIQRRCVATILENVRFASDIVNQILSFARRDPGADEDYDAETIVTEAVDFATEYLPSSMTVLRRGFGTGGPLAGLEVRLNRTALFQVVANLFKNAADATGDKGRIVVTLSSERAGSDTHGSEGQVHAAITVADNGRGIDPEALKHIFEPFFTTKAVGIGAGLGLSTIYGIVERWGGRIAVESAPGEGASFRVLIPTCTRN